MRGRITAEGTNGGCKVQRPGLSPPASCASPLRSRLRCSPRVPTMASRGRPPPSRVPPDRNAKALSLTVGELWRGVGAGGRGTAGWPAGLPGRAAPHAHGGCPNRAGAAAVRPPSPSSAPVASQRAGCSGWPARPRAGRHEELMDLLPPALGCAILIAEARQNGTAKRRPVNIHDRTFSSVLSKSENSLAFRSGYYSR